VIVRPRPHWLRLLFVRRGSLVHRIYGQQLFVLALSCAVVWAQEHGLLVHDRLTTGPFSLMGVALAIFLGFRINASYDRFWEARKQWGAVLVAARNLARLALTLPGDAQAVRPFVLGIAGFAAAMRNQLRALPAAQGCEELLPAELCARIDGARSAPALVLLWLGQWMQAHRRVQPCDTAAALQMEVALDALSMAHGSCERIANTLLPFSYSVILHRSAYLYCTLLPFGLVSSTGWWTPLVATFVSYTFFALEAVSDEIEEPFGLATNDLALDAMVVGIEASLREMLGEAPPPAPRPDRHCVLT